MSPWNYPGTYATAGFIGPKNRSHGPRQRSRPLGTNHGRQGQILPGRLQPRHPSDQPAVLGAVNICLLGEEDGFYHSSTYYGSKDIVAVGLGFQHQGQDGSEDPLPLTNAMFDFLAEKNLGTGGVGTLAGGYYHFDNQLHARFLRAGKLAHARRTPASANQPLIRWQQATVRGLTKRPSRIWMSSLPMSVAGFRHARVALGYSYTDLGSPPGSNAIQIGVQMQH